MYGNINPENEETQNNCVFTYTISCEKDIYDKYEIIDYKGGRYIE